MKTIQQALIDDIHYPISVGFVENVMIKRNLNLDDEFSNDIADSNEYQGALADCLWSLVQTVNFSEADKSVGSLSDKQLTVILNEANSIYKSIGEQAKELEPKPMVHIGG